MVPTELENLANHEIYELALWGNERLVWEMPRSNALAIASDRAALDDLYNFSNGDAWKKNDEWLRLVSWAAHQLTE